MVEIFDLVEMERKRYANYPRRSMYQNLKPYGFGTDFVESLTSYVGRLAYRHNVTPNCLVRDVVSSQKNQGVVIKPVNYHVNNTSLNGIKNFVKWFVKGLEYKTSNENFKFLTMLAWGDVLNRNGMFKKKRAWCPDCYNEMSDIYGEAYDPLIWFFEQVDLCPKHNRVLLTECPYVDCQSIQRVFNRYSNAYCQKCNRWLGASDSRCIQSHVIPKEKEWKSWVNQNIGELLVVAPNIKPPNIGKVFNIINECFEKQFKGNVDLFYGYMGEGFFVIMYHEELENKSLFE
ncbi:MAG: TniQ family protein [Lactobacillus sp.]|nr:TniQ family protein [Lactobacillus sp.]